MPSITVRLTDAQSCALRDLASREGVPVAAIVRQSVDALVGARASRTWDETQRRALAVAGTLRGGPTSLSVRHDGCVAEPYAE